MRNDFVRKMIVGSLNEKFDATKKVSDYAGMLTRIVFTTFLAGFVADRVNWADFSFFSITEVSYAGLFVLLILLTVVLGVGFINITRDVLLEVLWLPRYNGLSASRRFLSTALAIALGAVALVAGASTMVAVPKITSELAETQRHRVPLPSADAATNPSQR